ncbi:UNVERIFIED_CONTAM: hypothetical protein K2H54_063126 [Gekko kuhli]
MSQDKIVLGTKMGVQGLENLHTKHHSLLAALLDTVSHLEQQHDASATQEKASLLHKSLDAIKLGLGEAQGLTKSDSEAWISLKLCGVI